MTVHLHRFLPTGGDGRTLVDRHAYAAGDIDRARPVSGVRAPGIEGVIPDLAARGCCLVRRREAACRRILRVAAEAGSSGGSQAATLREDPGPRSG